METLKCRACGGDHVWLDKQCPHCGQALHHTSQLTAAHTLDQDQEQTSRMPVPPGVHVVESRPKPWRHQEMLGNRYVIEDELGHGGMGVVYKALDTHLDRHVALKVLTPSDGCEDRGLRNLFREARAVSTLNHPNIIQIHDINVDFKPPFIVMEYIPGVTIQERIRSGGIDLEKGCNYAVQIAEALETAHRVGIVHRDIKPGNVMVTDKNQVKVLDFGLARFREGMGPVGKWTSQDAGLVLGTVAYMSPEQTDGSPLDHRSDIFSLGILLFEMFFGRNPFLGPHPVATMHNIHFKEPVFPRDADPGLVHLLSRALIKDVDRRFQSMTELKDGFRALRARHVDPTQPLPFRAHSKTSKYPYLVPGLAAFLGLAGVVGVAAYKYRDTTKPATSLSVSQAAAFGNQAKVALTVLPVQIIAGDAADMALRDGLAESLSGRLAQLETHRGRFSVISAREVGERGVNTPAEAHAVLGADLVIATSLIRAGDRVRLVVELVDAAQLTVLNARTIDADSDDLLAFQDQVLANVHGLLAVADPNAIQSDNMGSRDKRVFGHYLRAKGYLTNYEVEGNPERALAALQAALNLEPDYAPAHAALGHTYLWLWRRNNEPNYIALAEQHADKAMALGEDLASSWVVGGMVAKALGQNKEAVSRLEKALLLNPVRWEAYDDLGLIYQELEDWNKARLVYQDLAEKKPDLWLPYNRLGQLYLNQSLFTEAESAYLKALELRPDKADSYYGLGVVYRQMGLEEKALEQYQKALEFHPNPRLYTNIGAAYYLLGRYDAAISAFKKALELGPSYFDHVIWSNLGDCFRLMEGHDQEAAEAYELSMVLVRRRLEVDPTDIRLHLDLALVLAKAGEKAAALSQVQRLNKSKNAANLFRVAMVHELVGERDQALAVLADAFEAGLDHDTIYRDPDTFDLQQDPRYDRFKSWVAGSK